MMDVTRRNLLAMTALGAGVTTAGLTVPLGQSASTADWISTSAKPARYARPLYVPSTLRPVVKYDKYGRYLEYNLVQKAGTAQILGPGLPTTPILGYSSPGYRNGLPTFPGPTIKVDQNTRVKVRVSHAMPATHPTFGYELKSSTHLHGSASLPQYDGYADDVTGPGQAKDYWYPNFQRPRTLWYHDHAVHHTATNVYSGLAAQYHVESTWEKANLPQGKYDVPLVISDAMFNSDGTLAYMDRNFSGLWGDIILVNGVPWPYFNVERRFYRFRILMATVSRSMNLSLVNTRTGAPLPVTFVAGDGGLMIPQQSMSWRQAGAERYEVMVDFSGCEIGDKIEMRNASAENNRDFLHTDKVMQFRVTSAATDTRRNKVVVPPASQIDPLMSQTASAAKRIRDIDLEHDDVTNEFLINGMAWRDVQAANWNLFLDMGPGDAPRPHDYEIWRIENKSGGWYHPLHIHLVDFKILSRRGGAGVVQPWEMGPKDVVYVGEEEIVEVLVHYEMVPKTYPNGTSTGQAGATGDRGGRYMIHCHNTSHEDHDMMGQFVVTADDGTVDLSDNHPNHPIRAARPA